MSGWRVKKLRRPCMIEWYAIIRTCKEFLTSVKHFSRWAICRRTKCIEPFAIIYYVITILREVRARIRPSAPSRPNRRRWAIHLGRAVRWRHCVGGGTPVYFGWWRRPPQVQKNCRFFQRFPKKYSILKIFWWPFLVIENCNKISTQQQRHRRRLADHQKSDCARLYLQATKLFSTSPTKGVTDTPIWSLVSKYRIIWPTTIWNGQPGGEIPERMRTRSYMTKYADICYS